MQFKQLILLYSWLTITSATEDDVAADGEACGSDSDKNLKCEAGLKCSPQSMSASIPQIFGDFRCKVEKPADDVAAEGEACGSDSDEKLKCEAGLECISNKCVDYRAKLVDASPADNSHGHVLQLVLCCTLMSLLDVLW